MYARCALCRKCTGAAYQSIPVFCCGAKAARYLVVAQNPGSAGPWHKEAMYLFKLINEHFKDQTLGSLTSTDDELARIFYQYDFGISHGRKRLDLIFGIDWLEAGKYAYTNAVRCRTPDNAIPSSEMLENCKHFTSHLIYGREIIFFMGALARSQYFPTHPGKEWVIDPKLGLCVFIKHYSAWKSGDSEIYKQLVDDAIGGALA